MPLSNLWAAVFAALYGVAVGPLPPRAVYRFAVGPEEPWRDGCPAGHPFGCAGRTGPRRPPVRFGPAGGWLGRAYCPGCPGAYGPGTAGFCAAGGLVCGLLGAVVGPRPELAVWLGAVPVALVLAAVDRRVHRLPDALTLPLAGGVVGLLGLAAVLPGAGGSWTGALLGAVVLAVGYLVLFLVHPQGMGFGDVKLSLALGAVLGWYGWGVLLLGTFLGFALAAAYGLTLVLLRRAGRQSAMAFGPFMLLGALGGVLVGAV